MIRTVGQTARRAWVAPLWAHLIALALVLIALLPAMSPESGYTSDEGAYALQERALAGGHWNYEYKAQRFDPEGRYFPLVLTGKADGRYYAYVSHPAYPLLLRGATAIAGFPLGLHLPCLVGVLLAAMAAWLLAAELDPGTSRPAFWAVAASPVLVNGYLLWAHALSAGVAGLATVAGIRAFRRGFPAGATGLVGFGLAAGVLLRMEGVLYAGGLLAALLFRWRPRDGSRPVVNLSLLGALPVAAVVLLERQWTRHILGGQFSGLSLREGAASSYLAGRLSGALHVLVKAHDESSAVASMPVFLLLLPFLVVSVISLRRWRPAYAIGLVAVLAAMAPLYVVRYVKFPDNPVLGLFPAWPLLLLGLLVLPFRRSSRSETVLLTTVVLFTFAVLLTQGPAGGGREWGGRYLSPAIAPLGVLAVGAIRYRLAAMPRSGANWVTAAVSLVTLGAAVFSLAAVGKTRATADSLIKWIRRNSVETIVTDQPWLPRLAWVTDDRLSWMGISNTSELEPLLYRLRAAGVDRVALFIGPVVGQSSSFSRMEDVPYDPTVEPTAHIYILSR